MTAARRVGGVGHFALQQHAHALQARVGDTHDAGVRVDRAEGEVRSFRLAACERVKDGGFADIR